MTPENRKLRQTRISVTSGRHLVHTASRQSFVISLLEAHLAPLLPLAPKPQAHQGQPDRQHYSQPQTHPRPNFLELGERGIKVLVQLEVPEGETDSHKKRNS